MPTTAPLAPGPFERLRRGYGTGPFSQMMLNMDLAPLPASLIDLTGGPETWLRAIEHPIDPDPEMRLLHGLTSLPEKAIGKLGLSRGWFSKEPAEFFGPHFAEARYGDLPQPVISAPRARSMVKYDPPIEYSPAWLGKDVAERELDRLHKELSGGYSRIWPREAESSIKSAQHSISVPTEAFPGKALIPPEKLTYLNSLTGERGPFASLFQKLTKRMDPKEFQDFVNSLKDAKLMGAILGPNTFKVK